MLVVKVAVSGDRPESVPVPSTVAPSLNVTVPDGFATALVPGATGATVAVKVTDWPETDGLLSAVNVVVVLAWLTVCVNEPELAKKLMSLPYDAVME